MKNLFSLLFLVLFASLYAQKDSAYYLSAEMPGYTNQLKPIVKGWKYQKGDDPKWAAVNFDDSKWKNIAPYIDLASFPEGTFEKIGWFRLWIEADTLLVDKTLALLLTQSGASEVFLDGKLIHSFGVIDQKDLSKE